MGAWQDQPLRDVFADGLAVGVQLENDANALAYGEYLRRRYFAPLDGLRALSILLVVTAHTTDPLFEPLHGAVGVTMKSKLSNAARKSSEIFVRTCCARP